MSRMKSWPRKALAGAGLVGLLVAIPAFSEDRDDPESLLPPEFGDPKSMPPPEEKAQPRPQAQPRPVTTSNTSTVQESPGPDGEDEDELDEFERPRPTNYFSIPEGRERPVEIVGLLEPSNHGLGPQAFGRSNGAF